MLEIPVVSGLQELKKMGEGEDKRHPNTGGIMEHREEAIQHLCGS